MEGCRKKAGALYIRCISGNLHMKHARIGLSPDMPTLVNIREIASNHNPVSND